MRRASWWNAQPMEVLDDRNSKGTASLVAGVTWPLATVVEKRTLRLSGLEAIECARQAGAIQPVEVRSK